MKIIPGKTYYLSTFCTYLSYAYNSVHFHVSTRDIYYNWSPIIQNIKKGSLKSRKLKISDLAILPIVIYVRPDDIWMTSVKSPNNESITLTEFRWITDTYSEIVFETKKEAIDFHNNNLNEIESKIIRHFKESLRRIHNYKALGPEHITLIYGTSNNIDRVSMRELFCNVSLINLPEKYKSQILNVNPNGFTTLPHISYYFKKFKYYVDFEKYIENLEEDLNLKNRLKESMNSWRTYIQKREDKLISKIERVECNFAKYKIKK